MINKEITREITERNWNSTQLFTVVNVTFFFLFSISQLVYVLFSDKVKNQAER